MCARKCIKHIKCQIPQISNTKWQIHQISNVLDKSKTPKATTDVELGVRPNILDILNIYNFSNALNLIIE